MSGARRTRPGRALLTSLTVLLLGCRTARADSWTTRVEALALPITIVQATPATAILVLFTGDGGWQAVDRAVAGGLAPHGVTTLGWSTVRYFVRTKEPTRVMVDLRRLLDALAPARLPLYLGGYSFGAEVAPVVLAQQGTTADRARIAGLLLLAPGASASFRVDPLDWIREPAPDPRYLVVDAVRRLAPLRTLCIAGIDDATTVCPALHGIPGAAVERVPGTHHFEHGMPQVVAAAVEKLFHHEREGR